MKKLNQQGVAHILMILLVIVVIGVIGGVGYMVYNKSKTKSNTTTTTTTTKTTTTTPTTTTTSTAGKTVEVKELNVKIADPDNRGLSYVSEDIEEPDGMMVKMIMIRDKDSAYFAKCKYPASLMKVSEATAKESSKPVKKIGSQWYEVGNGSHTQSACELKGDESAYKTYEDGIRQYIADNLSAL